MWQENYLLCFLSVMVAVNSRLVSIWSKIVIDMFLGFGKFNMTVLLHFPLQVQVQDTLHRLNYWYIAEWSILCCVYMLINYMLQISSSTSDIFCNISWLIFFSVQGSCQNCERSGSDLWVCLQVSEFSVYK